MKILPFALALTLVAPGAALAQAESAGASSAAETTTPRADQGEEPSTEIVVEGELPKEQRRVCEMRTETGSIVPRRVCRTLAQIEEEQRIARESLDIIRRDRDTRGFVEMSRNAGK